MFRIFCFRIKKKGKNCVSVKNNKMLRKIDDGERRWKKRGWP